jgi:hypothetical protein
MRLVLQFVIHTIQTFIVPICFICAWAIVILVVWNFFILFREVAQKTTQLHQIPCANCQFFTGSHQLKCTVHPETAMTEAAIGCADFREASLYPTMSEISQQ